ncbi:hypothetical protein NS220_17635 [Microbacterium testaceum]|uniref:LPXTG cell wall anchor domain-containing protein n=1 Tax=Microbacterium testaceum TaxID=2033 RepID=A0A147ESK6_MICTE|nr:LPXTG cell wall anchor domain-containing protein [Microbacterium testaceum]KTR87553.1 hypothetical protein NS220_17635 [Microbacterium testaceum]
MAPCPTEDPGAALHPGSLALTGVEWLPFAVLGAVLLIAGVAVVFRRRRALATGAMLLALLVLGLTALPPTAASAQAASPQTCTFLVVTQVDHPDAGVSVVAGQAATTSTFRLSNTSAAPAAVFFGTAITSDTAGVADQVHVGFDSALGSTSRGLAETAPTRAFTLAAGESVDVAVTARFPETVDNSAQGAHVSFDVRAIAQLIPSP